MSKPLDEPPALSAAAFFTEVIRRMEGKMVSDCCACSETTDLTCTGCGKKVLTPVYFDTRGRFYCDPCCWEVEEAEPTRGRNVEH